MWSASRTKAPNTQVGDVICWRRRSESAAHPGGFLAAGRIGYSATCQSSRGVLRPAVTSVAAHSAALEEEFHAEQPALRPRHCGGDHPRRRLGANELEASDLHHEGRG